MSMDFALWCAGIGMEVAVVAILVQKRLFRSFPLFCLYVIWGIINDSAMMVISRQFPSHYFQAFLFEMPLDFFLQICVLVELAWSVLRPLRSLLSRWAILLPVGFVVLAGLLVWPLAGKLARPEPWAHWHLLFQLQQTSSILRILFFLCLAGLSQFLAIGWKDRELQLATGLGLYSLVSLGAAAFHTHPASADAFHRIDQMVMASYLCSLIYWVVSFAQKEAPRQEFSPRMQNLLLSVAGTARASRMAMEEARKSKI